MKKPLMVDQSRQTLGANCADALKSLGVEGIYFNALIALASGAASRDALDRRRHLE
jgi:hypothetical protein